MLIDIIDIKDYYVSKEEFVINKYNFGLPFEDLVHNSEPYVHFQILRPESKEQREKALAHFNEMKKLFITSQHTPEILLYIGCTENIYIKSTIADVKEEDLKTLLRKALQWFRVYGNKATPTDN